MSRGLECLMSAGSKVLVGGESEGGKYRTYDSCFLSRLRKRGNEKRGRGRGRRREGGSERGRKSDC